MKHLENFQSYLKTMHYSKSSLDHYHYILIRAKKYFKEKGILDDREITEQLAFEYIQHLEKDIKSNWVLTRSVSDLNRYFNYLEEEKIVFINPMRNIDIPKEIRNPTKIKTEEEIQAILSKPDTSTDAGLRFRTILELFYSSALRPRELTNIKLTDIDFKKQTLFIRLSKNKKDRVVPVGKVALYWLNKYIKEIRPKYLKKHSNSYVFIAHNRTGKKINYQGLYAIFLVNLKRYNIEHFKPSSLRPSSATHLLQNGMGILYIKELLGHEQVTTTQHYLRVKERDLKRELESKHPRYKKQITMEEKNEI